MAELTLDDVQRQGAAFEGRHRLVHVLAVRAPSDFLILGGGTAGCVLADRLSADGATVTLVEAGPDYGPALGGAWPADLLDPRTPSDSHDWHPGAEFSLSRARVIGGCSAHNACFVTIGD